MGRRKTIYDMKQYQHDYYKRHQDRLRPRKRDWHRVHGVGPKQASSIIKRPYPSDGNCELCHERPTKKLAYHHWDDTNVSIGIWVCQYCHGIIEGIDRGNIETIITAYKEAKDRIEREWKPLL